MVTSVLSGLKRAPRLRYPVAPWTDYAISTLFAAHGLNYQDANGPIRDAAGRLVYHTGLDLNLRAGRGGNDAAGVDRDLGAPVYAVADGVVAFASEGAGTSWGNIVVVHSPGFGVWNRYAHLQRVDVHVGQAVRAGDQIGTIGKGYHDRWPAHLHWDVIYRQPLSWSDWPGSDLARLRRTYTDPLAFLEKYGARDSQRASL